MNAIINSSFLSLVQQNMSTPADVQNEKDTRGPLKARIITYRTPDSFDVRSTEMVDYHEFE